MSILSVLAIPGIMPVAGGSVLLISKVGGRHARKNIREMRGVIDDSQRDQA